MKFTFTFDPIEIRLVLPHQPSELGELKALLVRIASSITQLKEITMATKEDFDAGFQRVNVATSQIAALIRTLIEKQQAGNMSADEEAAAQTQLLAVADALEAMAATPTDPVPVPVPTP